MMPNGTRTLARPVHAGGGDERRSMRREIRLDAQLRDGLGPRFAIRLLDLSCTGFRAELLSRVNPGDRVRVSMPGMQSLEAVIAWQRGHLVGARFGQPLHPAVFDHIVALAGKH